LYKRNQRANEHRKRDGRNQLPIESRLLNAMRAGLPNCSGVALGVDRLAMLVMDLDSIDQVIAFPIDIA
jgi:lysyl-tRNA synthetase class 2